MSTFALPNPALYRFKFVFDFIVQKIIYLPFIVLKFVVATFQKMIFATPEPNSKIIFENNLYLLHQKAFPRTSVCKRTHKKGRARERLGKQRPPFGMV